MMLLLFAADGSEAIQWAAAAAGTDHCC